MKIDRQKVYDKYNGHCAYCGESIKYKQMQVDHILPKAKAHWEKDKDPDRFENLNPACRKCNHSKFTYDIEEFRDEMQKQVQRLSTKYNFVMALKYGQIQITEKPVVFYFEKVNNQ